jgi:ABC transporter substrate binding protein
VSNFAQISFVASYNRPGGNVTGINILTETLEPKRFGLLHELVPQAATIGFLVNARYPSAESQVRDVREAARALTLIEIVGAQFVAQEGGKLLVLLQERVLEIGTKDMVTMLDLIDDGGKLAGQPQRAADTSPLDA